MTVTEKASQWSHSPLGLGDKLGGRPDITVFLRRWREGDHQIFSELFSAVYDSLHALADRLMRHERTNHTLQATALVHEAFLSLFEKKKVVWRDRAHFYAVTARLMRHILVDHARSLRAGRRGAGAPRLSLDKIEPVIEGRVAELLEIDEALARLSQIDPRKAKVVELRFFGGLSVEEVADLLKVSKPTIILDTRLARAWIYDHLFGEKTHAC